MATCLDTVGIQDRLVVTSRSFLRRTASCNHDGHGHETGLSPAAAPGNHGSTGLVCGKPGISGGKRRPIGEKCMCSAEHLLARDAQRSPMGQVAEVLPCDSQQALLA